MNAEFIEFSKRLAWEIYKNQDNVKYKDLDIEQQFAVDVFPAIFQLQSVGLEDPKIHIDVDLIERYEYSMSFRGGTVSDFQRSFCFEYGPEVGEIVFASMNLAAFIPPSAVIMQVHTDNPDSDLARLERVSMEIKKEQLIKVEIDELKPGKEVLVECSTGYFMRAIVLGGLEEEQGTVRVIMIDTAQVSTCTVDIFQLIETPHSFKMRNRMGGLMLLSLNGICEVRKELIPFLSNLTGPEPLSCVVERKTDDIPPIVDILCSDMGTNLGFLCETLVENCLARFDNSFLIQGSYSAPECKEENNVDPLPFVKLYLDEQKNNSQRILLPRSLELDPVPQEVPHMVNKNVINMKNTVGQAPPQNNKIAPLAQASFVAPTQRNVIPQNVLNHLCKATASQLTTKYKHVSSSDDSEWDLPKSEQSMNAAPSPLTKSSNNIGSSKSVFDMPPPMLSKAPQKVAAAKKKVDPIKMPTVSSSKPGDGNWSDDGWGSPTSPKKMQSSEPTNLPASVRTDSSRISKTTASLAPASSRLNAPKTGDDSDDGWGSPTNPKKTQSSDPTILPVSVLTDSSKINKTTASLACASSKLNAPKAGDESDDGWSAVEQNPISERTNRLDKFLNNLDAGYNLPDNRKNTEPSTEYMSAIKSEHGSSFSSLLGISNNSIPSEKDEVESQHSNTRSPVPSVEELAHALCQDNDEHGFVILAGLALKMSGYNAKLVAKFVQISLMYLNRDVISDLVKKAQSNSTA